LCAVRERQVLPGRLSPTRAASAQQVFAQDGQQVVKQALARLQPVAWEFCLLRWPLAAAAAPFFPGLFAGGTIASRGKKRARRQHQQMLPEASVQGLCGQAALVEPAEAAAPEREPAVGSAAPV
jgi:hypothetical protein